MFMKTFFTLKVQTYQTKPISWLHDTFFYKFFVLYLLLLLSSQETHFILYNKHFFLLYLFLLVNKSLCLSTNIWTKLDQVVLIIIICFNIVLCFQTQLFLINIFSRENVVFFQYWKKIKIYSFNTSNVFHFSAQLSNSLNFLFYFYVLIYTLFSRIFLLTVTIEEILAAMPSNFSLKLLKADSISEFKLILILAVQALNLNQSLQIDILKSLKTRGIKNPLFSYYLLFYSVQLYIQKNMDRNKMISMLIYNRYSSNKSSKL